MTRDSGHESEPICRAIGKWWIEEQGRWWRVSGSGVGVGGSSKYLRRGVRVCYNLRMQLAEWVAIACQKTTIDEGRLHASLEQSDRE